MINLELKIPPVALVLICAVLMWLVSVFLPQHGLPDTIARVVALVFVAASTMIGVLGVGAFIKAKTTVDPLLRHKTSSLVTSGVYGFSRNPMYLGMLGLLVGFGLFLGSLYSLSLCVGFVLYLNRFQIEPEERMLAAQFPAEFARYQAEVRRWI
uniref:methyltransferase family protein n=1 Tax=Marinobacterium profundum TaxID=1714300 RepID=UPI00082FD688|nr:isoprenylcysteine carboxylmethyltransferase family protein [Marinobacterium profundum]